mmetsp:Transcript_3897/g.7473  ORF Transcript_3897/g.7473 Transcript_3897/m.7473 type:complete len:86 (+) Transcript_3897:1379-1636(+)
MPNSSHGHVSRGQSTESREHGGSHTVALDEQEHAVDETGGINSSEATSPSSGSSDVRGGDVPSPPRLGEGIEERIRMLHNGKNGA